MPKHPKSGDYVILPAPKEESLQNFPAVRMQLRMHNIVCPQNFHYEACEGEPQAVSKGDKVKIPLFHGPTIANQESLFRDLVL